MRFAIEIVKYFLSVFFANFFSIRFFLSPCNENILKLNLRIENEICSILAKTFIEKATNKNKSHIANNRKTEND